MIKFLKDRKSINLPYVEVTQTLNLWDALPFYHRAKLIPTVSLHLYFD